MAKESNNGGAGHAIVDDPISTSGNSKFSQEDVNLALKVQEKYGVPASVVLGQYAQESGYGQHTVGKNNYFNIKTSNKNNTKGYKNYPSKESSFLDFGRLLSTERYTSHTNGATTIEEYVQGVKDAGYAEDPNYVKSVLSIINSNGLYELDNGTYLNSGFVTGGISYDTASGGVGSGVLGLTWWGDIVRVVVIILIIGAGAVLLALAVSDTGVLPNTDIKSMIGGVIGGNDK